MRLILVGPPGAGKGTQATFIKDEFKIPHISTGDIFRQNLRDNTPLGLEARKYMNEGKLVPDELTIELVKNRLLEDDCKNGYLLDGFPRTINQAKALDNFLEERGESLDAVIDIEVDTNSLLERITGRRMCKDCGSSYHTKFYPPKKEGVCDKCGGELYQREDDREEAVLKRIGVYEEETSPLVHYYKEKGKLLVIDGNKSMEEVTKSVLNSLREL